MHDIFQAWSECSGTRTPTPEVFTGQIEVVRAPPVSSTKRVVRRSGFTIRKVRTGGNTKDYSRGAPNSHVVSSLPANLTGKKRNGKSIPSRSSGSVASYKTMVSVS